MASPLHPSSFSSFFSRRCSAAHPSSYLASLFSSDRTTTFPSSYRTMSLPSGSSSPPSPLPPEEEDCFRSPRLHYHADATNLITAYAVKLYNSAHLESDLPIPPLSTFSILQCAELMVAKSVMAIPEALAPTLSFSTTASGSCPAPQPIFNSSEQYTTKDNPEGTPPFDDNAGFGAMIMYLTIQSTAMRLLSDSFNQVLSHGRMHHNDGKVILTLCCHDDGGGRRRTSARRR